MFIRLSTRGALLAICLLVMSAVAAPAQAETLEPNGPAVRAALKAYGWKSEAVDYVLAHVRLIASTGGAGGVCPNAVACTTPAGVMYVNLLTDDQATFNYVINHEMIHAMQYARGGREGVVGGQLADLLVVSSDAAYPLAAAAASRVLGLSGSQDYPVLDQHDWFHMDHDVLQDVGWDVANLPPWFGAAYFPYLDATPPAATPPRQPAPGGPPADLDRRRQRVLDTVRTMCGPSLPGARIIGDMPTCGAGAPWSAAPYPAFSVGGRAPAAAPTTPESPPQAAPGVSAAPAPLAREAPGLGSTPSASAPLDAPSAASAPAAPTPPEAAAVSAADPAPTALEVSPLATAASASAPADEAPPASAAAADAVPAAQTAAAVDTGPAGETAATADAGPSAQTAATADAKSARKTAAAADTGPPAQTAAASDAGPRAQTDAAAEEGAELAVSPAPAPID